MLQKCYKYRRSGGTLTGEVYPHALAYIRAGELEAASWKLRAGNIRAQKQAGEAGAIGMLGCGFMFTGLLLGALSGSLVLFLAVVGIGIVFALGAYTQEQYKKKQAQAWRKNYPSYKY